MKPNKNFAETKKKKQSEKNIERKKDWTSDESLSDKRQCEND